MRYFFIISLMFTFALADGDAFELKINHQNLETLVDYDSEKPELLDLISALTEATNTVKKFHHGGDEALFLLEEVKIAYVDTWKQNKTDYTSFNLLGSGTIKATYQEDDQKTPGMMVLRKSEYAGDESPSLDYEGDISLYPDPNDACAGEDYIIDDEISLKLINVFIKNPKLLESLKLKNRTLELDSIKYKKIKTAYGSTAYLFFLEGSYAAGDVSDERVKFAIVAKDHSVIASGKVVQ